MRERNDGKNLAEEKKGGRERVGKFGRKSGGKKKNSVVMPTVALGIDFECDIIWQEEKKKKWTCATPTVALGVGLTSLEGR
jgi:hypothetical protein